VRYVSQPLSRAQGEDAVGRPDFREDDPAPGRERFYRRDLDPGRWLRVVVDFSKAPAFVVTAFVQDHAPGRDLMNLTIAGTTFDQHEYDRLGDVLYLTAGDPRVATRTIATPEGHAVDYDESGAIIGMMLVNARFLIERDGALTVTLPPGRVLAAQLEPAFVAA
jgi:uncharacterized protein YuzE